MAKKEFKAESKQLLNLMINSIYTHREIFLREIVSNASDAIDKLHYRSITEADIPLSREDFRIDISIDPEARTVTVSDNGVGMTVEDMEANLGVIAHSGSLDFKSTMESVDDVDIIGQFGVGFYSSFLVSDRVTVRSRPYGQEQAWEWVSDGADGYTVGECEKETHGTDVVMHIRDDLEDEDYGRYLDEYVIEDLVKKYSDYVRWPIHMQLERGSMEETGETDEEGNPKREWVTRTEDTVVNSMVPIWQRPRDEVSDDDCRAFYREKFRDYEDPVAIIRVNAEGAVSYRAMLFIPRVAPYNFYSRDFEPGLQLYSSGVMIMDKCKDLLPDCFRFVRGVVDSPDLSLNISREILQHDRQLTTIRNNLEKKIRNELARLLSEDRESYEVFHSNFGTQLKYGIVDGFGAKAETLRDLVLFDSFEKGSKITLREYVDAMPEGQERIYYASAESIARAKQLPQAEQVRDRGYDILGLVEDVDEFAVRTLREYDGRQFCDISGNDLGLESDEERKDSDAREESEREVLDFVKDVLSDRVESVRLSRVLKTHAVCLSTVGDVSLEMERYFSSIPGGPEDVRARRVLEINADHPAFDALKRARIEDPDRAGSMAEIMYAQAVLIAGMPMDDVLDYSERIFGLF